MADKILSPEEIIERLQDRKISTVARETGLHDKTLYALVRGDRDTAHIPWRTVRLLSERTGGVVTDSRFTHALKRSGGSDGRRPPARYELDGQVVTIGKAVEIVVQNNPGIRRTEIRDLLLEATDAPHDQVTAGVYYACSYTSRVLVDHKNAVWPQEED